MSDARPTPTNREVKLDPYKYIVSKTDARGEILYANDYFSEVSGYSRDELVGSPHSIVRHPDMPKAIFRLLWQYIRDGRNISAVIKNMTKNGDYYWVVTDFEIRKSTTSDAISQYVAFRHVVPKKVIREIEPLYRKMLEIEKMDGVDASMAYLDLFLNAKQIDYNQYIEALAAPSGLAAKLFEKMKRLFD